MELVSANTKEFMYMTMSQYNELNHDVPARVRIRRDQPFWKGGNSYLAAESFRISAAPSPGGLYYKKIPNNWWMRVKALSATPESSTDYNVPTTTLGTLLVPAKHLLGVPDTADSANHTIDFFVRNEDGESLPQYTDPQYLMKELGEVERFRPGNPVVISFGQQSVSLGKYKFTDAVDADNDPMSFDAVVQSDFRQCVRGSGFGPRGMFFPATNPNAYEFGVLFDETVNSFDQQLHVGRGGVTIRIDNVSGSQNEAREIINAFSQANT